MIYYYLSSLQRHLINPVIQVPHLMSFFLLWVPGSGAGKWARHNWRGQDDVHVAARVTRERREPRRSNRLVEGATNGLAPWPPPAGGVFPVVDRPYDHP